MRKRFSSVLLGIILVAAGVGYAGNVMNLWDFELFFNGWWTLFIIIPCAVSIIDHGFEAGNAIGMGIGIMLLLAAQDIIDFAIVWRLFLPLLLVAMGIGLIFRRNHTAEFTASINIGSNGAGNDGSFGETTAQRSAKGGNTEITAIFSGESRKISNEITAGARLTAVFGGVDIDLRDATIVNDIILDCSAIFGGIDLYLPPQTPVHFDCFKIFGGATDNRHAPQAAAGGSVYITGTSVFGSIEVK